MEDNGIGFFKEGSVARLLGLIRLHPVNMHEHIMLEIDNTIEYNELVPYLISLGCFYLNDILPTRTKPFPLDLSTDGSISDFNHLNDSNIFKLYLAISENGELRIFVRPKIKNNLTLCSPEIFKYIYSEDTLFLPRRKNKLTNPSFLAEG